MKLSKCILSFLAIFFLILFSGIFCIGSLWTEGFLVNIQDSEVYRKSTFFAEKEIVVAVVDTGIDRNHPELKNNIHIPGQKGATQKNFGRDFSSEKVQCTPYDQHGHGTHVSGIIKKISPNVKILPLKYYNPKASGVKNLESTIKALEYAVDNNVDIINYSGGGANPSLQEYKVLKKAESKGIVVVVAAGNECSDIDQSKNAFYPASYKLSNIITVMAHDGHLKPIKATNWGKNTVHISAPGEQIESALPEGGKGRMTGTSQATAFVSGSMALLMSKYPYLSYHSLKEVIMCSAKKSSQLNHLNISGGRLSINNALNIAKKKAQSMKTDGGHLANSKFITNKKISLIR